MFRIWRAIVMSVLLSSVGQADPIRRIGVDSATGMSEAIIVEDHTTWHSSRIVAAPDATGKRPADLTAQAQSVLKQLARDLEKLGAGPQDVVRLNVGMVKANEVTAVRQVLESHFPEGHRPVVTFVGSQMPESDALIAIDAVGLLKSEESSVPADLVGRGSLCPAGPKVYVSGKAANGDLATATRDTLQQIDGNLQFLKLAKSDIVQLRAFVTNVSEIEAFHREVRAYLGDLSLPAVTFTQWISSGYPIEIEAVVKVTSGAPDTEMEFITPPGETASPVYCRVVRVPAGPLIYTAGLTGDSGADAEAQIAAIFQRLQQALEAAGSDMHHLAKATYFCGDDASSTALNAIRPSLYDPQRPPAASKAIVPHVGLSGRAVTLDWIAVPKN